MPKRISRKLLVGLGSIVTFGAVGTVSGFSIKSIIDSTINNNNINQLAINGVTEDLFSNAPDYNVATKDMFIDSSNLKRFHFGNTLIGQTVTPYGWLGVFDDPYNGNTIASTRIALTGWNGEILWVNEPSYESGVDKRNYNVYDMEYDFKNDLIFVLRTWSSNGLLNDNDEKYPPIRLDILDAKTGKEFDGSRINWKTASSEHFLKKWQDKALNGSTNPITSKTKPGLKATGYLDWKNSQNRAQSKNLYQLDLASSPDQKNLLLTWMPDFMRLTKNFGKSNASSITLKDFIELWDQVAVSWIMLPEKIKQNTASEYSVYFDLFKSDEIEKDQGKTKIKIDGTLKNADEYYLVANPFFTVGKKGSDAFYIMHIIFADKNQNVYHKIIGWDENQSKNNADGRLYNSNFDKTQKVDWQVDTFGNTGGFLVEKDKNGGLPSWTKREKYDQQAINANTRINKNMFDNNSIVFAYPFGVGSHLKKWFPIFNVAQMYVEPTTGFFYSSKDAGGDFKKKARQFYFGRDIASKDKEMAHYPGQNNKNNINQTYHRLISVSPFDNTFIYSEKPNIKNDFFNQGVNDNEKDWAGFFIGKSFRDLNTVRPFFIWNSGKGGTTSGIIDSNMTSFEKLYEDGFTFDLKSFVTSTNNGAKAGLNLYFNQNGNSSGNTETNGIKTRKIGMISDIFQQINNTQLWVDNGALATQISPSNLTSWYNITGTKIDQNSFSTINHSRADLEKWYPRTFWNNTKPSNLITADSNLNSVSTDHKRATAKTFGSKLTGTDFDSSNKSVDLVSAWEENEDNYNRLIVKRPVIKVKKASVQEKLPVITEYNYANENDLKSNIWIPKDDKGNLIKTNLVLTREQNLPNVSFKIFSSWKDQFRMQSFGNDTSNISPTISTMNSFSTPEWIDTRGSNSAKAVFGKGNNAVSNNNKLPLRLMLKIVKPTGTNLPSWFNSIPSNLFNPYPVEVVGNETTFSQVLNEFINKKTELLNMSDTNNENQAVGLGNLKIEAYLGLNPAYMSNSDNKVYKNSNEKMIIDSKTGQRIIYKDEYTTNRLIYDQSQIDYVNFNKGGFGNSVKAVVQESWKPTINPSNKVNVKIDASKLKDELVRKSQQDQKLFTFDYEEGNKNLIITPKEPDWLRPRLLNFQRMINMKARFEYQTSNDSTWKILTTTSDADMKNKWASGANTFKLPTSDVIGITKLRIKLIPNIQNEQNSFVDFGNTYSEADTKFISAEQELGIQRILVDKGWITTETLTNTSLSLADIKESDIKDFENKILNKIADSKNREQVKLVYSFDNSPFNLTTDQLAQKIKEKFNNFNASDQGVFALWNGITGTKIRAKFDLKNQSSNFELITANNNKPSEADLSNDVQSNIKSKIDISDYINQLQSTKIVAQMGASSGTIKIGSIKIPNKNESGRFQNKTFNDIKSILENQVGVKIKFQKQQKNGIWDSTWSDDLDQIITYWTSDPKFRIGFFAQANYNVEILNGTTVISNNGNPSIELKLNLPKVITIDDVAVATFRSAHGLGGNTKNLTSDQTKIDKLIDDIKKSEANSSIPGINNVPLEVLLQLGGNGDYQTIDELKTILSGATSDKSSNLIKIKFRVTNNQDWILANPDGEYTILNDKNTTVPIFVHDANIWETIKNQTSISGTNENLTWTFPTNQGFTIESDDTFSNSSTNGKGLKLQFSTNENANINDSSSDWTTRFNRVDLNVKSIFIRIIAKDNTYVYEKTANQNNEKITINLNQIREQIHIQSSWLNQPLVNNPTNLDSAITVSNLDKYEKLVKSNINNLDDQTKSKLVIKYSLNDSSNNANWVDKNQLVDLVSKYTNSSTFNILQLWNGHSGVKIFAKFDKADANGSYDLIYPTGDLGYYELSTDKITTTINFEKIISWLTDQTTKIDIEQTQNNKIKLKIPQIPNELNESVFQGKSWADIQNLFSSNFGITIEYRSLTATNINNNNLDWTQSWETLNQYDENIGKYQIRFKFDGTKSKNIKLKLTNSSTVDGTDTNPTELFTGYMNIKLMVKVNPVFTTAFNSMVDPIIVTGNTKNLTIDPKKEQEMLKQIKDENIKLNPIFSKLNLEVRYQLGEWQVGSEGKTREEFQKQLSSQNNMDQKTNKITFIIAVSPSQSNEFGIANNSNYILHEHETPSATTKIKYFVNKRNWEVNADNVTITGTNNNLNWNFNSFNNEPTSVNEQSGLVYLRNEAGNALQLQFTTNANAAYNDNQVSSDLNDLATKWVTKKPTIILPTVKQIKIRIVPTLGFEYEPATLTNGNDVAKVHTITPQITTDVIVNADWLNLQFNDGISTTIENFNNTTIDNYESKVKEKAKTDSNNPVDPSLLNTFDVQYQFNNDNSWVNKEQLITKIQEYKNNNSQTSLGILQLWNNQSGVKIKTKFVDANKNDSYKIQILNERELTIDTSNFITTVDFINVLEWLKKQEVQISESTSNTITTLNIPNVDGIINTFGNKTWTQVQSALESFGINIMYSNNINGQPDTWGTTTSSVNKYDPKKPSFKIKFKTDGIKSKNIKLKLSNTEELNGQSSNESQESVINIKAKLLVEIPENLLNSFKTSANIRGNTKNIIITDAQSAETKLIQEIIEFNKKIDNRYEKLDGKLELHYALTDQVNNVTVWKKLDEFKTYLQSQNTDQITNEIKYKIVLKDDVNFSINSNDTSPKILSPKQLATATDIKIKYYINSADWETKAGQIQIEGTSDNLQWNFGTIFSGELVEEKNDGKVYLRTNAGEAIQVYFTTNATADYNNPSTSDDENQINSNWVSKKPSTINAATTNLKIKLVANSGYVYGPAESGATTPAKAHNVAINIKKVLYVDKNWLSSQLVATSMDISALSKTNLDQWENKVYQELIKLNNVSEEIAKKIKIDYFFDDEPNIKFDTQGLINKITQLRQDYNNADLGILQLWDGTRGKKLKAIFKSNDQEYIIRVQSNQNAPTNEQISNVINTNNIYTTISMTQYIDVLKTNKTTVSLDANATPGKMKDFTPPSGKTNPPNEIFDGKSYEVISNRLNQTGVKIEFSKDNQNWVDKENLKEYDIQKNAVFLRFTVKSSNIKLQLDNQTQIENNQTSQLEIKLPLQVPKYIVIDNSKQYWDLTNQFNFNGTTKGINFDQTKINEFIEAIKTENVNAGGDQDYKNAPLEIQFQVGTGSDFVEISKLKKYLENQPDDLPNREIKFKFTLKDGTDSNKWKIQNEGEYPLLGDQDPKNNVKLYINDKGVFNQLKQMTIKGSNDALNWNWPELVKPPVLDEATGILTPGLINNFGKGLKFEFTFNKNHQNASVGTDAETQWVPGVPKKYDANKGFTDVYLRIKLTKNDYYTYDYADQTITLSLSQVGQNIILQTAWLEGKFNNGQELNLGDLTVDKIDQYEQAVKQKAKAGGIDQSLLNKFTIKYQFEFNGNLDDTKLITKDELIQKISDYKNNKNQSSLGILQLWNQTAGVKIAAKFVDADESDKYYISVDEQPQHKVIDTTNVITTIDFSKVIEWLIQTNKLVQVKGDSPNATFTIPEVNASGDDTFNKKEWSEVEKVLSLFGITTQYREILDATATPTESNWKNNLNEIKKYDQNIGKIGIRFKFNNQKARNIKFKTGTNPNEIFNGKTTDATNPFELSLDIKLNFKIDQNIVDNKFVNKTDVISGNTKFLKISENDEQAMIAELIKINVANNEAFNNAGLTVKYKLKTQSDWKFRQDFIDELSKANIDQESNEVLFKFEVSDNNNFIVDGSEKKLFNPKDQNPADWKVKIFINNGQWETNASNVVVTGINSALKWEWKQLQVNDESNNKVGNNKLQVEFSAKPGAAYDDTDVEDNGDIKTKWTRTKPTQLDPTIQDLWIRLKAKAGYVYGPAYTENGLTKTAKAHRVNLQIKREIIVDPKRLSTSLSLPTGKQYVTDIAKADLDKFVQDGLGKIQHPELQAHVTVKFNFNNKIGLTSQELYDEIQLIIKNNNAPNYGILQLWNTIAGKKIQAYYDLINPNGEYILVGTNNSNPKEPQEVVTRHIRTKINLVTIVNELKNQKIKVETITSKNNRTIVTIKKWIMPDTKSGNDALNGLSWDVFEKVLKDVGVSIKARIVKNPDTPNQGDWKPLDQLKEYDDTTLKLALRFELVPQMADNVVLSVLSDGDVDPDKNKGLYSSEFQMNIKAPAKVVVEPAFITTFIRKETFTGDTKFININSQPEEELINNIVNKNLGANADVFKDLKDRLEVQYYLGKNSSNNEADWRTAEQFKEFLKTQSKDQETNKIWFRLNVKDPEQADGQVFQIDKNPQILVQEQIHAQAKIKIYINETGFSAEINKLKAAGSTDSFVVDGLDNWKTKVPKGLEIGYSKENDPDEADETQWTQTLPSTLTSDKKLWIRFKVKDGYVYENAKQDQPSYGQKHQVDTTGIKVIIKLKTEWLEKILINGNTKKATINEQNVLKEIVAAGVLPTDQPDLIQLEYNIKGSAEWFTKSAFESKLDQLNGAKDDKNFILKRDDLQIRFNIKKTNRNDDYGLNIDDENVTESNYSKFNKDIVAQGRNESFKGYINLVELKDFAAESFKIIGSTSKPKLIISKRDSLNTSFMPYISDNLFDIQFSTVKNVDGSWDWTKTNQSILSNGQLINDDGLITQGITIGAEKHFAIRFISKDLNYDVYKGDQIKKDGYLLDLTSNVIITVEIINPFTTANKALGIWTRNNKKAKYNQGQGGFKIVAAQSDWTIDPDQIQSAQEFLNSSNLTQVEKDALEFVYHIFPNQPSSSDVDELKSKITNYQDSSWKPFIPDSDDWSDSLGLRVGDYVSVALRVKESYTNKTDGAFILKDDDYAMLIPITNDKEPGRLAGYEVDVDKINIRENNIGLFNNEDSTLPPIDGYTSLAKISLDKDEEGQYLGVDLDLQVYSEFYLNKDDGILVAPVSKQRLIKRDEGQGITNKGNYKDASGQDLTDKEGKTIPILKDVNNRLAKPIKGQERTQALDNLGSGEFKLPSGLTTDQNEKLSFFRNQDIDVKLKGRVGKGTEKLPDYYANKERTIELKNLISPRIKFTVDNDNNVKYEWPQEEFNPGQIKYQNSDSTPGAAKDGKAEVATILKIKRWENNQFSEISGSNINEAIDKLNKTLNDDFDGQLRFETIYQQATGNTSTFQNNNIYQLKNLKNRDRITVRIVATDDDLYYTGEPNPLVINVNGLVESAPKQEQLQYLRVEQSGRVDGEGSFRVLATDPSIPGQTNDQVLSGWKFMLRVWSKNKEIKTEWTDDQTRINNLENGDKVEWKLVSADGNPVDKAYYNTVALNHEYDENNHVKYNFAKVNFPDGETSKQVVEANIGEYPTTNEYPENSGYVIAGLKPVAELFKISSGNLAKIFDILNPTYVGLNHQGAINFDNQYLNNNYYVNTDGEVYQKLPGENNLLTDDSNNTNELFEISVEQLLENVTFYNQDPVLNPYQNGFKFSSNAANINNHLSNGDQIWAQFNIVKNESNGLNAAVTIKLNTVNGLKNTSDPMSPFWYVLMALGGIVTLGLSGIIVFVLAKRKKLKGKN